MATLTVIRHGQASFLADNYDQLSELGRRQARLLGEYWLRSGERFDRVFTGPRERQKDTASIVGEVFQGAGQPWPEATVLEDLDEFPAEPVVRRFTPILMAQHAHIREWAEEFQSAEDIKVKSKALDRVIQEVTARWLAGEVAHEEVGTWEQFTARVHGAIGVAREATPKGGATAVFTSGGPSAAAVQYAVGLSLKATLDLTWMTRNAAFAEFIFDGERFNLSVFNATPHLGERELLTYR
ncbi:MAG: histidine phosphatase family protein [Acidobacteriota bacterium]